MKKFILLLTLTISLSISATTKDTLNAVTMVAYEQRWLDSEGTLALKNNTNEDIHNITYRLTYLDMNGNALDYKDYSSTIDVAAGMTKKVNIPAYEYDRNYSYYTSEASLTNPHRFKVKFELTGYNLPDMKTTKDETDEMLMSEDAPMDKAIGAFGAIVGMLVIGFFIGMYALVAVIASRRNRNAALWVFASLFFTPVFTIIILLCLGEKHNPYDYRN